jgi:transglutaminase-like putative cysteine protease
MFLDVEHHVWLRYDGFIRESFIELRLSPKTTAHQTVASFVLAVGPPAKVGRYRDWNGNLVHHLSVTHYHDGIEVLARSLVDTHPAAPPLARVADVVPAADLPYELLDFLPLEGPVRSGPALARFNRELDLPRDATLGRVVELIGAAIHSRFQYRKNVTRYDSTTDDFLKSGAGVCQDFTHLMLGVLRLRRIPCRYVSGYLHTVQKDDEPAQSHAWIEFHSASHGWVPFDPTHFREIDERYVVVAHGRHYDDVPPNKGIYRGGAGETLRAEVRTTPSAPKAVSALHEEIRGIELPVYQEAPARRPERRPTTRDDILAEQQQQQQ